MPIINTHKIFTVIAVFYLLGSYPTVARQTELNEPDFPATMKEIGLTVGDAEGHIDARYWPETEEDGKRLAAMFQLVEEFWLNRGTEAAARIAADAVTASNNLTTVARANDFNGSRSALGEIRKTCGACHQDFREETEDGYQIKSGS